MVERVTVPQFEIVSHPRINLAELRTRKFNVVERLQEQAIKQLTEAELEEREQERIANKSW